MGFASHTPAEDGTLVEPVPLLLSNAARSIVLDHGEQPLEAEECARVWSHAALKDVELFQGSYRKYEFAPHFHSVPAIGVVDRGAMRCDYRSATHDIPTGGIILLNPGDVHAPGPLTEQGWSFRVFFLDNALFQAQSMDVTGQVLRFEKPYVEHPRLAETLVRLHFNMEDERGTLEGESGLLKVFELLAEMQGNAPPQPPRFPAEKGVIRRVREYVDAHYQRNISLADLSAAVETSPFHLLRTFRQEHAYLIQVRIETAKRLLRSRMAIAEVADFAGFADQSHLTRHFKRLTGVTPSRYRP
jgi:AraC-like DNA-binding protein